MSFWEKAVAYATTAVLDALTLWALFVLLFVSVQFQGKTEGTVRLDTIPAVVVRSQP